MSAFWRTASIELGAAGDKAAVDAKRLAEGADEDVDPRAAMLFGAAAGAAVGGDAMRVVHHRDDAVAEAILVFRDELPRSPSTGALSPRMLKMPSKMTTTRPVPSGTCREMVLEILEVVVLVDGALRRGHVGDPHRADDAVVIQRVANPVRVGAGTA